METINLRPLDAQNDIETKKKRFWELDFIRGLCVILMIFDHIMFSVRFIFKDLGASMGTDIWTSMADWISLNGEGYWHSPLRIYVRLLTLFGFFFVCGVSCSLSKSNIKRGIMCFLVGCGITFFTVMADKIMNLGCSIYFGVLHMLGLSIIIYGLIDLLAKYLSKAIFWVVERVREHKAVKSGEFIPVSQKTRDLTDKALGYLAPTVGLIMLILFFCLWGGFNESGEIVGYTVIDDPSASIFASLFVPMKYGSQIIDGVKVAYTVGGADEWQIIPWGMIVLLGGFVGKGIYRSKSKYYLERFDGVWNKPVCFVGKHAIVFYVLHQVVIFIILYIITLLSI